jgi:hypothetical protein
LPHSSALAGGDSINRKKASPIAHTKLRAENICFSRKEAHRHEVKFIIILLIKPHIICRFAVPAAAGAADGMNGYAVWLEARFRPTYFFVFKKNKQGARNFLFFRDIQRR